ncbi:UDP-2,4-diacetamido-2,4,6-trideoxy-beta-L-altropyranose hydrolase [Roseicitreum antarcticum]|uniref:UDP-2,4-diacetamido-2,4,6-trideoxy-beta-L-altropyranose hydrolase n=1 Tax=Roseicitreum antarcticum TaxID=564137 RepID=A0A1H3CJ23_9RHOB|nr:UDP-2,4-diacetamido-2,4,6-trideoxy-beta-L-altropyranose hydrolase [Roseicitreum antarcticum]SDX54115.1 UDP-2,4-diacetamido-2,4,6-trideoxy-beta-L-altropyranose hydrolase [Roseicitreum antarcticum]
MKALIRADATGTIGGGHMMRCLALANALRRHGHEAAFVMAQTQQDWSGTVTSAGFHVYPVTPEPLSPDPDGPPHKGWLSAPWPRDAEVTGAAMRDFMPDCLIWDHYGLDARWVNAVRRAYNVGVVLAIDDLDDRALGSELVLDQTRLDRASARAFPALAQMAGPAFATLRPEFADLRAEALARRAAAPGGRVLVTLGLADSAGIVPGIAAVLAATEGLDVDIVMGAHAQTLPRVADICATYPQLTLHVDTPDMAALMLRADLCIGAGGMTSWERCCLGLGTLLIPVADNQSGSARALEAAGAAQVLDLTRARDPADLAAAVARALRAIPAMAQAAARLCDGQGATRVVDILAATLRPVVPSDAHLMFDWRNQPHIRAASLNAAPLEWPKHLDWVAALSHRSDGLWRIYAEGERALGHVNVRRLSPEDLAENSTEDLGARSGGLWRWGFYIGAVDAPKGAGRRMLARALSEVLRRPDCAGIEAEVRVNNPRSAALHRAMGFRQTATREDGAVLVFLLTECDMNRVFAIQFPKEPR